MTGATRPVEQRPGRGRPTSAAQLDEYYRTVAELREIARELGVPSGGVKADLLARLRAQLDGQPAPDSPNARSEAAPGRHRSGGRQGARALTPPFSRGTELPGPTRLTRELRDWFASQVDTSFRANQALRDYLASDEPGRTLGGAVDAWTAGRESPTQTIAPQFEYNRFVREFRAANPGASHGEVVAAWKAHRDAPRRES